MYMLRKLAGEIFWQHHKFINTWKEYITNTRRQPNGASEYEKFKYMAEQN